MAMIKVQDLGDYSKEIFKAVKRGDKAVTDMIDVLMESDFSKKDIFDFVTKKFKVSEAYKSLIETYLDTF